MPLVRPTSLAEDRSILERVVVLGTSGSGKTTFARELASKLGVTHVEFDAYRHGPNWTETPNDIFRGQLGEALSGDGWVADGNYSIARDVVWPRAAAIVWLDYRFPVVFWRLWWRTMSRSIRRTELWNGNKESLWEHFFTKHSLFLWLFKTHWSRSHRLLSAFAQPEYSHLHILRFRSPRETRRWLESFAVYKSRGT